MSGTGRSSVSVRRSAATAPVSTRPQPSSLRDAAGDVGHSLRLPVFVAVNAVLGVGAHALVQRSVPDPLLLVVAVLAVAGIAIPLGRRELSFEMITAGLLVGQAVTHVVLCLGHGTVTAAPGQGHAGHGAMPGMPAGGGGGQLAHLYPGHTMLLAHLLAAGIAAWWLRQGEAAVWTAVSWIWPGLPTVPVLVVLRPGAGSDGRPFDATVNLLTDQVAGARAHQRRGPPERVLLRAPALV